MTFVVLTIALALAASGGRTIDAVIGVLLLPVLPPLGAWVYSLGRHDKGRT